jgi:hypothetical protein
MYKMIIDSSGEPSGRLVFLFRGHNCRRKMLEWYDDYRDKAASNEGIKRVRVWGTVGNKTDLVLDWVRE